jgi:hypothetical protein
VRALLGSMQPGRVQDWRQSWAPTPHVRVLDEATGAELLGFYTYDPAFTGGVFVAGW